MPHWDRPSVTLVMLSLIHSLDASHRIGSRIPERSSPTRSLSVELMRAWLYVRLIAYFQEFSKVTGPFSSFWHTISMSS